MPDPTEKRAEPRLAVTLAAHCRVGDRYLRESLTDVSPSGLFLATRERFAMGAPVRVALALPYADGPRFCTLVGTVVRVAHDPAGSPNGLGVAFEGEVNGLDRELLKGFIALWGGRKPARA